MDIASKLLTQTETGFAVAPETAVAAQKIARELSLDEPQVDHVIATGVPMLVMVTAENAQIVDLLFRESRNPMRSKSKDRKMAVLDFFGIFGEDGRKMNEAIASQTGVEYIDVNGVMALLLPTLLDAIADVSPKDAAALRSLFRIDAQELQAQDPGLAALAA